MGFKDLIDQETPEPDPCKPMPLTFRQPFEEPDDWGTISLITRVSVVPIMASMVNSLSISIVKLAISFPDCRRGPLASIDTTSAGAGGTVPVVVSVLGTSTTVEDFS